MFNKTHKKNGKYTYTRFGGAGGFSDDIVDEILGLPLRPVDEANAVPRPDTIDKFYVEEVVQKRAEEQPPLWDAEGEAAARDWKVEAAKLRKAMDVAESIIANQQKVANQACETFELTARTLGGYTRRAPHERWPYYIRWLVILGGDVAGVAGAAILLGETVELGIMQALSSGTAAITTGLIAHEIKDSRLARKREKPTKELTPDERRFAHLFRGADSGERIVKYVVGGGLFVSALIASSIFALRLTTQGSTAGWAFGFLAAAVALASWANVYHYTDEVADLIDARRADYQGERKRLKKLSKDEEISGHNAATAEADSIGAEAIKRGEAAVKAVEALGPHLLTDHPGAAGHGWPKVQPPQATDEQKEEKDEETTPSAPVIENTTAYEPPPEVAMDAPARANGDQGVEE